LGERNPLEESRGKFVEDTDTIFHHNNYETDKIVIQNYILKHLIINFGDAELDRYSNLEWG